MLNNLLDEHANTLTQYAGCPSNALLLSESNAYASVLFDVSN